MTPRPHQVIITQCPYTGERNTVVITSIHTQDEHYTTGKGTINGKPTKSLTVKHDRIIGWW